MSGEDVETEGAAFKGFRQTVRFLGQAKSSRSRKKPAIISQRLEKGEVAWYNSGRKEGSLTGPGEIMIDKEGGIIIFFSIIVPPLTLLAMWWIYVR